MGGAALRGRDDGGLEGDGELEAVPRSGDHGVAASLVLDEWMLGRGRDGGDGPSGLEVRRWGDVMVAERLGLDERELGHELCGGTGSDGPVLALRGGVVVPHVAPDRIVGRLRARLPTWR